MSQTLSHYRTVTSQFEFTSRFTCGNLDTINTMSMIPTITHQDPLQYQPHMAAFLNSNNSTTREPDIRKTTNSFSTTNEERERREITPVNKPQYSQQLCIHGTINCVVCCKSPPVLNSKNKLMVDVCTMTEPDDDDICGNWQNVSVPPNNKVAEYLTSLRQFLKLSTPGEKKKKQLGDVRIMTSADGTRLFCCPECQVAYPDKALLEPHLAGHKIERRWLCGVCGAGLKRKEHLDRHQLCHTEERPYTCTACPKSFKRSEHLTRHFVIHSGEKAQELKKKFICGVCGSGHSRRELLERHEETHLEHRPFSCTQCGKSFKRNEHLARHAVTHSGLKPHACIHCGKAFYRKDHLVKHAQSHTQPPRPKLPIP